MEDKNKKLTIAQTKLIPVECPNCKKVFKNVYSMSSHKAHCMKLIPPYAEWPEESRVRMAWSKGKVLKPINEIFKKNSRVDTGYAKDAVIKLSLMSWKCQICKVKEWQGKMLMLELDHINGDNKDHRLENIRLLCPNCHSQTDNWRGRNKNSGKLKVTDDILIGALKKEKSIRQALLSVGLAAKGGNYQRCKLLVAKFKP